METIINHKTRKHFGLSIIDCCVADVIVKHPRCSRPNIEGLLDLGRAVTNTSIHNLRKAGMLDAKKLIASDLYIDNFYQSKPPIPHSYREPYAVYLMHSNDLNLYKIGYSVNPDTRLLRIRQSVPDAEIVSFVYLPDETQAIRLESYLHMNYAAKRQNGEWFDLSYLEVLAIREKTFNSIHKQHGIQIRL